MRPNKGEPEKIAFSRGFVKIIERTMWEKFRVWDMAEILCKRLNYLKFGKRKVGFDFKGLRDAQVRLPHLFSRCVRKFCQFILVQKEKGSGSLKCYSPDLQRLYSENRKLSNKFRLTGTLLSEKYALSLTICSSTVKRTLHWEQCRDCCTVLSQSENYKVLPW